MTVDGTMISMKVKVLKHGKMELNSTELSNKEKRPVRAETLGPTKISMKETE